MVVLFASRLRWRLWPLARSSQSLCFGRLSGRATRVNLLGRAPGEKRPKRMNAPSLESRARDRLRERGDWFHGIRLLGGG